MKFKFALEWDMVKTGILLILHPKRMGLKYPYNTSLIIEVFKLCRLFTSWCVNSLMFAFLTKVLTANELHLICNLVIRLNLLFII